MAVNVRCIYQGTDLPTSAGSLVSSSTATTTTVTKATVVNHTSASDVFSVWILPSGVGATADRYLVVDNKAIPAGQTYDVAELRAQTLNAGDSIWAIAGTATTLAIRINAQVVS